MNQSNKKTFYRLPTTVSALAILLLFAWTGCTSTHSSAGKTLSTENFELSYSDKAQVGAEIEKLDMQHPLPISERQIMFHMVALKYENYSLLGEKGSVFTKDDIKNAKRLLTKALNHADPQNIIGFKVESEKGTTEGELFASKGDLHWRFSKIKGIKHSLTRNQMARYGTAWTLVAGKKQKLYVTDKFLGAKRWDNWIVAPINLPAPSNLKVAAPKKPGKRLTHRKAPSASSTPSPAPSSPAPTAPKKDPAELEKKLKFLKYLHENELIDQSEYEKKRKDLLDQYL